MNDKSHVFVTHFLVSTTGKRLLSQYPMENLSNSKITRLSVMTFILFFKYSFSEKNISFDKIIFVSGRYSLVTRRCQKIKKKCIGFSTK